MMFRTDMMKRAFQVIPSLMVVPIFCLALGGCHNPCPYRCDYSWAERSKTEYRIYQCGTCTGSRECWIPLSEMPVKTSWTDTASAPPITLAQAIQRGAEKANCSAESLRLAMLTKDAPPNREPFWKYVVEFAEGEAVHTFIILMDGRMFEVDEFYPKR